MKVKSNNKGFTLVELMVTLVILGILMGIGAFGLTQYYHYSIFKENNEYAQSIFASMQSSLEYYKSSGQLDELSEWAEDRSLAVPADVQNLFAPREVVALCNNDPEVKDMFKEMLEPYIYDPGLLNAAILIEMDVKDATVLGVSYSNRATRFSYSEANGGTVLNASASSRVYNKRYDVFYGYYDAQSLTNAQPGSSKQELKLDKVSLVNEDMLTLEFGLDSKVRGFALTSTYQLGIYDSATIGQTSPKALFTLELSGFNPIDITDGLLVDLPVLDSSITQVKTGNKVKTYVKYDKNEGVFKVVLDAIDLAAADFEGYDKTLSAKRFGFTADSKIYGKVTVSNAVLKNTDSALTNNIEPVFYETAEDGEYGFAYMRHLYNIRFTEKDAAESIREYIQTGDHTEENGEEVVIDVDPTWTGRNGVIAKGYVFDSMNKVSSQNTAFPQIELKANRKGTTITQADDTKYRINGLLIKGKDDNLGLFKGVNNEKTITNLILNDIVVDGVSGEKMANKVGALCGESNGAHIENIKVTGDNSSVKGREFVGGVIGVINDTDTIRKLESSADVEGGKNVGGIVGRVEKGDATFVDCHNYGTVSVSVDVIAKEKALLNGAENFGGILGSAHNGKDVVLTDCSSTFGDRLSDEQLIAIGRANRTKLNGADIDKLTDMELALLGNNVGGLVGQAQKLVLSNCTVAGGTIRGNEKVGGYIGNTQLKQNEAMGSNDYNDPWINYADVVGRKYVGGILGINGADLHSNNYVLQNMVNYGVVTCTDSYAGGIVGANVGTLVNVRTDTDNRNMTTEAFTAMYAQRATGKYTGGLAGYNLGSISTNNNWPRVIGHDFTGGLVGWNPAGGTITTGYPLDGGVVVGNDGVGGYIGWNNNVSLGGDITIVVNDIVGHNAVGGYIGIDSLGSGWEDVNLNNITINAPTGRVRGEIYVGGLIGYATAEGNEDNLLKAVGVTLNTTTHALESSYGGAMGNKALNLNNVKVTLAEINGYVYTTGMIGRNFLSNRYAIRNSTVETLVNARCESGLHYINDENIRKTWTGGFIGWVEDWNNIIEYCTFKGMVLSDGQYHGGFAEGNKAAINNNTFTFTMTDTSADYVGGIVGYNAQNGQINNCTVEGTVTGHNYVGGLAAYNNGQINNCTISGTVNGTGEYIGGYVGYNDTNANITISASPVTVHGLSGSRYVGGIVGYNKGSNIAGSGTITTTVSADQFAGGLIGMSEADINGGLMLNTTVSALTNAGGLVGVQKAGHTINPCTISGTVTAGGWIGSIASANEGIINSASVENMTLNLLDRGDKAMGGVAGNNSGTIQYSKVNNDLTTNVSGAYVGGIAGINTGNIIQPTLADTAAMTITSENGYAGGVVGRNQGGTINSVTASADLTVSTKSGYAGGVVGYQTGTLNLENNGGNTVMKVTGGDNSCIGGLVGKAENADISGDNINIPTWSYNPVVSTTSNAYAGAVAGEAVNSVIYNMQNNIPVTSGLYGAGIVGKVSGTADQTTVIEACVNYADITAVNASGIVGQAVNTNLNMNSDVNVGCMKSNAAQSLSAGALANNSGAYARINDFRNYGYQTDITTDKKFYGITPNVDNDKVVVTNSFGVAVQKTTDPLTDPADYKNLVFTYAFEGGTAVTDTNAYAQLFGSGSFENAYDNDPTTMDELVDGNGHVMFVFMNDLTIGQLKTSTLSIGLEDAETNYRYHLTITTDNGNYVLNNAGYVTADPQAADEFTAVGGTTASVSFNATGIPADTEKVMVVKLTIAADTDNGAINDMGFSAITVLNARTIGNNRLTLVSNGNYDVYLSGTGLLMMDDQITADTDTYDFMVGNNINATPKSVYDNINSQLVLRQPYEEPLMSMALYGMAAMVAMAEEPVTEDLTNVIDTEVLSNSLGVIDENSVWIDEPMTLSLSTSTPVETTGSYELEYAFTADVTDTMEGTEPISVIMDGDLNNAYTVITMTAEQAGQYLTYRYRATAEGNHAEWSAVRQIRLPMTEETGEPVEMDALVLNVADNIISWESQNGSVGYTIIYTDVNGNETTLNTNDMAGTDMVIISAYEGGYSLTLPDGDVTKSVQIIPQPAEGYVGHGMQYARMADLSTVVRDIPADPYEGLLSNETVPSETEEVQP